VRLGLLALLLLGLGAWMRALWWRLKRACGTRDDRILAAWVFVVLVAFFTAASLGGASLVRMPVKTLERIQVDPLAGLAGPRMVPYARNFYETPTLCEQVRQFEPNQPARRHICRAGRAVPPPPDPDPPPVVRLLWERSWENTRVRARRPV
jgi:hypothetical protein